MIKLNLNIYIILVIAVSGPPAWGLGEELRTSQH